MAARPLQKSSLITGYLITFVGAVLFSSKAILVKLAFTHTSIDALTLLALRMVFSLPFYLVTVLLLRRRSTTVKMSRRQWLYTLLLGLFGFYLSSLFDFMGLKYISAGMERLILFLYPTFVVLINAFVFKQQITRYQLAALLLTYSGIGIAYIGELHIDTTGSHFVAGSLFIFMCAVTYSIYIAGSGRIIPVVGDVQFTAYAMLAATAGIFIHFLLTHRLQAFGQNPAFWRYGIALAVFTTVIPSFLLSNGMKKIGSTNAAIVSGIGPVATIVQAHFILGEKIFGEQIIGTVLVIAGVLILSLRKRK